MTTFMQPSSPMSTGLTISSMAPAGTTTPRDEGSLAPVRPNPWRSVGRTFEATSSIELARIRSGLDWSVEKRGLRTDDLQPIPDAFAMRRQDTGRILGIVGRDYVPMQNHDLFEFFSTLAGERELVFETAGAFQGGKIVWVLARIPDLGIRLGEDLSHTYLLISNGHAGNKVLTVAPTTIRVICQNTLALAEAQSAQRRRAGRSLAAGFQVRHTSGMPAALADIREAYASTFTAHARTREAWEHLARVPLTRQLEKDFIETVFRAQGPDEADRAKTMRQQREQRLSDILASPTSQVRGTKDTAFSLLQATIEYIDHDRPTRTGESTSTTEARLASATFGSGAGLKEAAWTTILAMSRA